MTTRANIERAILESIEALAALHEATPRDQATMLQETMRAIYADEAWWPHLHRLVITASTATTIPPREHLLLRGIIPALSRHLPVIDTLTNMWRAQGPLAMQAGLTLLRMQQWDVLTTDFATQTPYLRPCALRAIFLRDPLRAYDTLHPRLTNPDLAADTLRELNDNLRDKGTWFTADPRWPQFCASIEKPKKKLGEPAQTQYELATHLLRKTKNLV